MSKHTPGPELRRRHWWRTALDGVLSLFRPEPGFKWTNLWEEKP